MESISNIKEYFECIKQQSEQSKSPCFFRGESRLHKEPFTPSIKRVDTAKEHDIYYHVLTTCAQDFNEHLTYGEVLAKMQHYGVPTRLLDITSNPLVALYFACNSNNVDDSVDGVVYTFQTEDMPIKTFESDTVAILASLPRISQEDYVEVFELAMELCGGGHDIDDDALGEFNQNSAVRRLLHEIKKEKPDFEQLQRPRTLLEDIFYVPKQNNSRIVRQQGAFLMFGMADLAPFEGNEKSAPGMCHYKIIINSDSKKEILSGLKMLSITKSALFPELYTIAESIKSDSRFTKINCQGTDENNN